jgi:drug/metabolite transporter (DMT)-like permease
MQGHSSITLDHIHHSIGATTMKPIKIIGILFIVAGILALVYGGFSYPKSHDTTIGPVQLDVKTQEHVNVPMWAGVGAIVLGGVLLLLPGRKK